MLNPNPLVKTSTKIFTFNQLYDTRENSQQKRQEMRSGG